MRSAMPGRVAIESGSPSYRGGRRSRRPGRRGRARRRGREPPQVAVGENRARRVVGRVDDEQPGARRDSDATSSTSIRKSCPRAVARRRDAAHVAGHRLVDREAGVGVDDLVALVDQGEHGEEHDRLGAGRDDHLVRRRPIPSSAARRRRSPRAAADAGGGGVVGGALLESAHGRRPPTTLRGVSKSGSPISRWMTSRPVASSARARAAASKAVSVPIRSMRLASFTVALSGVLASLGTGSVPMRRASGMKGPVAASGRRAWYTFQSEIPARGVSGRRFRRSEPP